MTTLRLPLVLLSLLAAAPVRAEPELYALDPVHTRVAFQVEHAGLSRSIGTFSGIEGELHFDADAPERSQVRATIPIASLDLGDADWNEKILDRGFLDAPGCPHAQFRSTRVVVESARQWRVEGELTLRGVTAPVILQVRFNADKRHPLTLRRTLGFSAQASLKRSTFGITRWGSLIGEGVSLIIEVEAIRQRRESEHADPQ